MGTKTNEEIAYSYGINIHNTKKKFGFDLDKIINDGRKDTYENLKETLLEKISKIEASTPDISSDDDDIFQQAWVIWTKDEEDGYIKKSDVLKIIFFEGL